MRLDSSERSLFARPRGLSLGFLASLCVVSGLAGWHAAASTEPAARIVFVSKRDGFVDIYTMNARGEDIQRITNDKFTESFPVVSPDKKSLLYSSDRSGHFEIYRRNLATGQEVKLTHNLESVNCYQATWSPDGKMIAYERIAEGRAPELWLLQHDGTLERQVSQGPGWYHHPVFSPTDFRIAFAGNHSADAGRDPLKIFVLDLDTGKTEQLTSGDNTFDTEPAWAPDGRSLAFGRYEPADPTVRFLEKKKGLYRVSLANHHVEEIISSPNGAHWMKLANFSSDGNFLVFSYAAGQGTGAPAESEEIYVMDLRTRELRRLTSNRVIDWQPRWY